MTFFIPGPVDCVWTPISIGRNMKSRILIRPRLWYLLASLPLAGIWLVSHRLLEAESYHYRIGEGLRFISVLSTIQLASLLGLFALVSIALFIGSCISPKLHDVRITNIFSIILLWTYGLWSLNASLWIMMK